MTGAVFDELVKLGLVPATAKIGSDTYNIGIATALAVSKAMAMGVPIEKITRRMVRLDDFT